MSMGSARTASSEGGAASCTWRVPSAPFILISLIAAASGERAGGADRGRTRHAEGGFVCYAIFGDRAVKDWGGLVAIEAPDRTQHAAIVGGDRRLIGTAGLLRPGRAAILRLRL